MFRGFNLRESVVYLPPCSSAFPSPTTAAPMGAGYSLNLYYLIYLIFPF